MKVLALGMMLVPLLALPASAAPEDVANQVSAEIMSPFCPGVTLHDCPSDSAVALRDRITEMAARGLSRAEILSELEAEYGPTIRATPETSGTGLLAWVLPGLALVVGAVGAWTLSRRWSRRPASAPEPAALAPRDRQRLDGELAKLRGEA